MCTALKTSAVTHTAPAADIPVEAISRCKAPRKKSSSDTPASTPTSSRLTTRLPAVAGPSINSTAPPARSSIARSDASRACIDAGRCSEAFHSMIADISGEANIRPATAAR